MNRLIPIKSLMLLSVITLSNQSLAELKPLEDTELEATVGQAYIKMDGYTDANSYQVSRITFGQDVKVQANADSLDLGYNYDNGSGLGNDFSANNVSLGYIDTATNTIVPFEFTNPYFEWVTDATNNMIGFRMGAEESKGMLQMDLTSFSGNIDMTINGAAASLFTGVGGSETNSRATHIGTSAGGCTDNTDCISIGNINSLDVADTDGSSTADFFLSFQKVALDWNTDAGTQAASSGFFMNIPTNTNIVVTQATSSNVGYAVEFIDRGVGRWNTPATP